MPRIKPAGKRTILAALLLYTMLGPSFVSADHEAGDGRAEHASERVQPLFGLTAPSDGPFPADRFTVADADQNTCGRVNLPKPVCAPESWECVELDLLNELDGFSVTPRVAIPFSGPIDLRTANSATIFFVSLGSSLVDGAPECIAKRSDGEDEGEAQTAARPGSGWVVGVNQLVWEPTTNTLYAEADESLQEHTRYALIVTRGVHDSSGYPIAVSKAFERFRSGEDGDASADPAVITYRRSLRRALAQLRLEGVKRKDVAIASVFTTVSVASLMQKLHEQVVSAPTPSPIDFNGLRTVFELSKITGMTWNRQASTAGPLSQTSLAIRLASVRIVPGAVSKIAFGRYMTPNYLRSDYTMPPVGSFSGVPSLDHFEEVVAAVFIPAGQKPAGGWPVVLFGHGSSDSLFGGPFNVAAQMASHGLATVAINLEGNGFGRASTVTVMRSPVDGGPVTFSSPGRSDDVNGDNLIGVSEAHQAGPPKTILISRHTLRQSATDMMQLVREIQIGVDVDGDGIADLDASHIYYVGTSAGSAVGVLMFAVEPAVRAAAFVSAGGRPAPWLAPPSRSAVGQFLSARVPPLVNSPGLSVYRTVPVNPPFFDENIPDRGAPPLVNAVAGAIAIQEEFERVDWISSNATIGSFAPFLRLTPLAGVPARPLLILEARGDQTVPNPLTAGFVRSGLLADRVMLYRHDLFDSKKSFPDPHSFFTRTDSVAPVMRPVALAAQDQVATFFESDGATIIDPDGAGPLFEAPAERIWEDYGFIVP